MTRDEVRFIQQGLQKRDVGRDAANAELGEHSSRPPNGRFEVTAATSHLDEHGVEMCADLSADEDRTAVKAHPGAASRAVDSDPSGVRTEAVGRVLGGDPALNGGTTQPDTFLGQPQLGQRGARGDPELVGDDVDVGDLLGDRVLDLDTRVHLDEDVAPVGREQELDRASIDVTDRPGKPHGVCAHLITQGRVKVGCRGCLDDLLMPSLDGTVSLVQMDDVARRVRQDLHFDVAWVNHGLLQEDGRVAKG